MYFLITLSIFFNILPLILNHWYLLILLPILLSIYYFTKEDKLPKNMFISRIAYDKDGRYYSFYMDNTEILDPEETLEAIYNTLYTHETFLNFGLNKIIIASVIVNNSEVNYHHNILINNKTTLDEYKSQVLEHVNHIYDHYVASDTSQGMSIDYISHYKVIVWNVDDYRNKNIKITKSALPTNIRWYHTKAVNKKFNRNDFIMPLENDYNYTPDNFATMDIETINYNGIQMPIAISACTGSSNKLILIDKDLFKVNPDSAVNKLWQEYLDYISKDHPSVVLVHNLGTFDGYFLFKGLLNLIAKGLSDIVDPERIKTMVDNKNKFIEISLKLDHTTIQWKDSYRIFPLSLDKLCENFGVEGKITEYNQDFNNINLLDNKTLFDLFKEYSLQDAIALYNALYKAQEIYMIDYQVDIISIYSTSTLSLKIFRKHFMEHKIPILKRATDTFIRRSYFGGSTDYYKAFAESVYYYDVNSIYPYVMKNPMPNELIKTHFNPSTIDLNVFFGFIEAKIECPDSIRPVLPYKHKGRTIHPTGSWIGVYFSEELKAIIKLGYIVTPIKGYEFSKIDFFSKYVDHFYRIKNIASTESKKWIAKMHLNQLYGYFGRSQNTIETITIRKSDLIKYLTSRVVSSYIELDNNLCVLLLINNVNQNVLSKLRLTVHEDITSKFTPNIKANVAIASAVTAYARIHMIPFKIDPETLYTDTDSFFTTKKLDPQFVGSDLGLMKDEMKGCIIQKAYFLGIKKYGYWYYNNNLDIIEKSTCAGIKKDTITFNEIKSLFNGITI